MEDQIQSVRTLSEHLESALRHLKWVKADHCFATDRATEPCWLRRLLEVDQASDVLTVNGRMMVKLLVQSGLTLQTQWPRPWQREVDQLLGARFYFTLASWCTSNSKFVSIVSSQIGRHGQHLADWPSLIDAALQSCQRTGEHPLIVEHTTLATSTKQYAERAHLASLHVVVGKANQVAQWLQKLFEQLLEANSSGLLPAWLNEHRNQLLLSPPESNSGNEIAPLQDRMAFALADRVIVLSVRAGGNISELVKFRLSSEGFPAGTLFLVAPKTKSSHDFEHWLEMGAVGWLLQRKNYWRAQGYSHCVRHSQHSAKSIAITGTTLSFPMPKSWLEKAPADAWAFLSHCTRGNSGPNPEESIEQFRDRIWQAGQIEAGESLLTLMKIVSSERLLGNSRITRTSQRCVSFSAVPLPQLLARRKFQAHLGRWDWEPYGLMFKRASLAALGARPVIYGSQADYESLAASEQPYFQPNASATKSREKDWSLEREWRLLGDLDLKQLDPSSLVIFTATQAEAAQLARHSRWPVMFVRR